MKAHGHRMGFHSSARDEEYAVEAVDSTSPSYGSGTATPPQPGSYPEYIKKLHQAFRNVKPQLHEEKRTVRSSGNGTWPCRKRR
jgi:hypothetical protein